MIIIITIMAKNLGLLETDFAIGLMFVVVEDNDVSHRFRSKVLIVLILGSS